MECDEAHRLLIGDAGRFTSRLVLLKQPYFMVLILEEDNLGGIGKLAQKGYKFMFHEAF